MIEINTSHAVHIPKRLVHLQFLANDMIRFIIEHLHSLEYDDGSAAPIPGKAQSMARLLPQQVDSPATLRLYPPRDQSTV